MQQNPSSCHLRHASCPAWVLCVFCGLLAVRSVGTPARTEVGFHGDFDLGPTVGRVLRPQGLEVPLGKWTLRHTNPPDFLSAKEGDALINPEEGSILLQPFRSTPAYPAAAFCELSLVPSNSGTLTLDLATEEISLNGVGEAWVEIADSFGVRRVPAGTHSVELRPGVRVSFRALSLAESVPKALLDGPFLSLRLSHLRFDPNAFTATAVARVAGGFLVGGEVVHGGRYYHQVPAVRVTGGGGTGAQLEARIEAGEVVELTVIHPGRGYTSTPYLTLAPPWPNLTGVVNSWGHPVPGAPSVNPPPVLTQIAVGAQHALGLRPDGTLIAWGEGAAGAPPIPEGLVDVVAIGAGNHHFVALQANGTAVNWGLQRPGDVPPPSSIQDVRRVVCGGNHTIAVRSDGTLVAWGDNAHGQAFTPPGLIPRSVIGAGQRHSLAVFAGDSTTGFVNVVRAWGDNAGGQCNIPVDLVADQIIDLAGGDGHSLALKSDGTVVAWGLNSNGQASVPAHLNQVVAIAAGANHSVALRADGTVWVWGDNAEGQGRVPAGIQGASAIAAGAASTYALVPSTTHLTIRSVRRVAVDLQVQPGRRYRLETSADLHIWQTIGEPFLADQFSMTRELDVTDVGRFFRLVSF